MNWDPERSCYQLNLELGGEESFKFLLNGDWRCCLYPDETSNICGPDDAGHGHHWTITAGAQGAQGSHFEIRLFLKHGSAVSVDWVRIKAHSAMMRQWANRVVKDASSSKQTHPLFAFLAEACPEWTDANVTDAHADLLTAGVDDVHKLKGALRGRGTESLPMRLRAVHAPAFTVGVLRALTSHAEKEGAKDTGAMMPSMQFEVLRQVFVRERACADVALGILAEGEMVSGSKETFDGWLKLDGLPGWVYRCEETMRCVVTLQVISKGPGPQQFLAPGAIPIHEAPAYTSEVKLRTDEVWADFQTYNGWLHLVKNGGWVNVDDVQKDMPCQPALPEAEPVAVGVQGVQNGHDGQEEPEAPQEASEASERHREIAESLKANADRVRRIRRGMRNTCVDWDAQDRAEAALLSEQEAQEAKQAELQLRIAGAVRGRDIAELADCAREDAGAQRALKACLEQRSADNHLHSKLLRQVQAAAAAGDAAQMRRMRDAAKKAGIPSKAISRAFALGSAS